jgi:phage-related protein (TIGR01555 family)
MSRKNPYMPAKSATPAETAKPAAPAQGGETSRAARMALALDSLPVDPRGPSLRLAETHRTEPERYTAVERRAAEHALDFNGQTNNALTFVENTGFPGFPTLALLAQLPEYRTMHETLADECVRCWGKVVSAGSADAEKLQEIEAELERIDMMAIARQAIIHDQAFGGAHVYFKLKGDKDNRSLPMLMKPYSVPQGSFEGLRVVEPYWVTPNYYNSIDPTAADFYKPSTWWMLGIEVHATRMQTLVSRPVPDMLKPTYSFRGVSMSQLAVPYVDNWLRTRQSVSDTVKQFSISGVKTDLQQSLAPGAGQDLLNRAQLINAYRDSRNIMFLDMATEEFFQVNTPLSGLDALQAQAQEQMAAVSHIPLVKLLGVTPTGLNASSEGEIRVFYDYVRGYQKNVLMSLMLNAIRVIQLSLYGEVDPHVIWEWAPLMELTKLEEADARAKDADTDAKYVEMGAVTAEQVAEVLHNDAHSRYAGIIETGETLETTADEDIPQITQHILGIGAGDPDVGGGPLLENSPQDDMDEANEKLAGMQSLTEPQNNPGAPGGANSDPTLTDPNYQADPGEVDGDPDDLQTAQ